MPTNRFDTKMCARVRNLQLADQLTYNSPDSLGIVLLKTGTYCENENKRQQSDNRGAGGRRNVAITIGEPPSVMATSIISHPTG